MTPVVPRGIPDSKVHEAYMGPTWDRQDPGGPHLGPMNLVIRVSSVPGGVEKILTQSNVIFQHYKIWGRFLSHWCN